MDLAQFPVAILAGGLGTRLRPITEAIPKVLVSVAGRPFLLHQFDLLRGQGVRRVVLCLGQFGEQVRDLVGDGREFGLDVVYSFDGPKLLGTGGALRRALPYLGEWFFVLYGDSYLGTPFEPVATAFLAYPVEALMTVYRNEGRFDRSNVIFQDGRIALYDKREARPGMHHIDYGLSIFTRKALLDWPDSAAFDLSAVFRAVLDRGTLAAFEVKERFYEIGSPEGLAELENLLLNPPANSPP